MPNQYPKLLLLCSFDRNTANAITINNLFKKWPKDRIAVAETNYSPIWDIYVENINRYYILGQSESRFVFPFNFFRKPSKSQAYLLDVAPQVPPKNTPISKIKTLLYKLQILFLNLSGYILISRKYWISESFKNWIEDIDPDMIYTSMGDISKMDLAIQIKRTTQRPLTIHVFDDFVQSRYQYTIFKSFWKNKLDLTFRELLKNADLHFAISEKMAKEYQDRYGIVFYVFHNPIDEKIWIKSPTHKKPYRSGKFVFVYAGKVNKDTNISIKSFYKAINNLKNNGVDVDFHLYSPYSFDLVYMALGDLASKVYKGNLSYHKLIDAFQNADGLLLSLNNTKKTIKYIRLSMLTKATEYMVSQTPVFVYAPSSVAVFEYMKDNSAGFLFDSKDHSRTLEDAILYFIKNNDLREEIAGNAYGLVQKNHLSRQINELLVDKMMAFLNKEAMHTL